MKKNNNKNSTIIFGVLDLFSPNQKYLKEFLSTCGITENISVVTSSSAQELINKLKRNEVDYILVPSRLSYDNVVSNITIDIINRMNIDGICETFCFVDKDYYYVEQNKEKFSEPVFFGNKIYKQEEMTSDVNLNKLNFLEYKIYKKNNYKRNWFSAFITSFFTTLLGQGVFLGLSLISACLLGIFMVLPLINKNVEPNGKLKLIGELLPLLVIVLQIFFKLFNVKKKAQRSLITGYWLYYSFEDQYVSGSFVPKGFTTRLLEITNKENNLVFNCKFSGNDTNFFSSSNNEFEFSIHSNVGEGSYHYVTNIINNKGKRAEGVCMYRGIKGKRQTINFMDGWFSGRGTGVNGRVKYLRISKKDYEILTKAYPDRSISFCDSVLKFGIYGDEKSNTDVAFIKEKENDEKLQSRTIQKVFYNDYQSMLDDLNNRRIDGVVVPISNRGNEIIVPGINQSVFKFFDNNKKTYHYRSYSNDIKYVLASLSYDYKLDKSITVFVSNSEAFRQCSEYIKDYKQKVYPSTSAAAKAVATTFEGRDAVVICNKEAASYYCLNVLLNEKGECIDPYTSETNNVSSFAIFVHVEIMPLFLDK